MLSWMSEQLLRNLTNVLLELPFSRRAETEADLIGKGGGGCCLLGWWWWWWWCGGGEETNVQKVELVWAHLQAAPGWHLGQPDKQPAAAVVCYNHQYTRCCQACSCAAAPLLSMLMVLRCVGSSQGRPRWACSVSARLGGVGCSKDSAAVHTWLDLALRSCRVELVCACVCDCHCPKPGRCSGTPNTAAPAAVCRGQQTLTI